ncbi:MAG: Flp pilus assembly complex ATPase component TadA, partial [Zoogloea sp.]|nr:Flp pilus assembly complex ATPase component TadA [Zoogloea sp.]
MSSCASATKTRPCWCGWAYDGSGTISKDIVRTRAGTLSYLAPEGALHDGDAVGSLGTAIEACIASHELRVVLDLGKVTLLSSQALAQLLACSARLAGLGGWLRLNAPNALIGDILRATGLDRRLEVFDSGIPGSSHAAAAPSANGRRLGDILIERGLTTPEQLAEAARLQRQLGLRIGRILIEKGWVPEHELLQALSTQLDVPYLAMRPGLFDPSIAEALPQDMARRLGVLPMFRVGNELTLATTDPQSMPVADEIERASGCRLRWVLAAADAIQKSLFEAYSGSAYDPDLIDGKAMDLELIDNGSQGGDANTIDELAAGSPVINLVNSIIQRAIHDNASDIHLELFRAKARVRFRIDGVLYEVMNPRPDLFPALISRLKVMANLDIAERRLPQDGRIQVSTQGRTVDLRFSSLPGIYGEKVVLRVLDKGSTVLDLHRLGLAEGNLGRFRRLLSRSHGLLLVTGPTGSGKTTTLYGAIDHLRSIEKNIVTIEDPVEYQLDIINQNQVNEAVGLTFPRILRHVLRQDPDIIMVGEIRDRQTAEIAVQAALTGHLVLSTLHTNDAIGAVARLVDMGVEPYLLSSALIGVMAQRLVRRICPECRSTYIAPPELVERFEWQRRGQVMLARGRGCRNCYDSGYKGRVAIHELIDIDRPLQSLIVADASYENLREHVRRGPWPGL